MNNGFDVFVPAIGGGIAASYLYEDILKGYSKSSFYSLAYAQHLSIGDKDIKLIPSLKYTYAHRKLDPENLGYLFAPPQYVPYPQNSYYHDLSGGLLLNFNHLYLGGSYSGFTRAYKARVWANDNRGLLSLHASYNMRLGQKNLIRYSVVYDSWRAFRRLGVSVNSLLYTRYIIGIGYSSNDNTHVLIGYRHHFFSAGVGYNVLIIPLAGNSFNSWTFNSHLTFVTRSCAAS